MGWRGVVRAAAAAALLSCGERGAEPSRGAAGSAASSAEAQATLPPPVLERGDRHARAASRRSLLVKRVEGTLAWAGGDKVVIRRPGAPELTLHVSRRTVLTVNGKPSPLDRLAEGAEVRAAYQSGPAIRPTALSIEIRSAPPPDPDNGTSRRPGGR